MIGGVIFVDTKSKIIYSFSLLIVWNWRKQNTIIWMCLEIYRSDSSI